LKGSLFGFVKVRRERKNLYLEPTVESRSEKEIRVTETLTPYYTCFEVPVERNAWLRLFLTFLD